MQKNIHRERRMQCGFTGRKKSAGFTLFVAVVTTSIVLAIGISILNITLKEFILSSLTRDSEKAFYAADAGIECATYWDTRSGSTNFTSTESPVTCMGSPHTVTEDTAGPGTTYTIEDMQWGTPAVCARVTVQKTTCSGFPCTVIVSSGHNKSCEAISDVNTLQRTLRATY